jgi:hypothetical protein
LAGILVSPVWFGAVVACGMTTRASGERALRPPLGKVTGWPQGQSGLLDRPMGEVRFGRGPCWISGQPRRQGTDLRAGSLFRAVLKMRIPAPMSTPAAKQRVREYVCPRVARIWRYSTMAAMAILCHRPYQRQHIPSTADRRFRLSRQAGFKAETIEARSLSTLRSSW